MADATIQAATDTDVTTAEDGQDELLEAELLVEDVSIDGMCGVY
jgi:mycofactocin precursor